MLPVVELFQSIPITVYLSYNITKFDWVYKSLFLFWNRNGQDNFIFRVGPLGNGADAAELEPGQGLADVI